MAAVFVAYFLAAELGWAILFRAERLTPFWPAAAVSLAAMLLLGSRVWPAIVAADLVVSTHHHYLFFPALGVSLANTLEALLANRLLRRAGFDRTLLRDRDLVRLVLLGGLAGPVCAGAFWVLYRLVVLRAGWSGEPYLWFMWVRCDMTGILLLAPFLLVWTKSALVPKRWPHRTETVVTAVILLALDAVVFTASPAPSLPQYAVEYLPFAVLVWMALRLGMRSSTLATLVTASMAIWSTIHARGPFAHSGALPLHLFLLMVTLTTLIIAITIAEHRATGEELAHAALHDQLTELPNRALLVERTQSSLARLRRHAGLLIAVLFIDLDDFKVVNDSLGHDAGDELIKQIAQRLKSCLRGHTTSPLRSDAGADNTLARIGGDEFAVLLEDISEATTAIRVAERMREAVAKPFVIQGHELFKNCSIGVAVSSKNGSAEEVIRNADIAMYRAKSLGGGRCEIFDIQMHLEVKQRLQLESELWRALERQEFCIHYQPIVSLVTGRVTGLEALLRWNRPGAGLTYPKDFLPIIEGSGLIRSVGEWVLSEACAQVARWQEQYRTELPISIAVNVSGKQFNAPGFTSVVERILRQTKIKPDTLHLEITESAALEDVERTSRLIEELKTLGVHLMLDDFGTGYSSMSYLRRFAVHAIKIDRSFVSGLDTNRENRAIIQSLMLLAKALGMEVIAEGVETPEELAELAHAGCSVGQGYLFSKPLDCSRVEALLQDTAKTYETSAVAASPAILGLFPAHAKLVGAGCESPQHQ